MLKFRLHNKGEEVFDEKHINISSKTDAKVKGEYL